MQTINYNYGKQRTKLSFGAVIPVKVYVNGAINTDEKVVGHALRSLGAILQKHNKKEIPKAQEFMDIFAKNVKDYTVPKRSVDCKYPIVRKLINLLPNNECLAFLFTGKEAEELNKYGKKIGLSQGKVDKYYAKSDYANAKKSLLNEEKLRHPSELRIYTIKGKDSNEIQEIMFRKQGENRNLHEQECLDIILPWHQ